MADRAVFLDRDGTLVHPRHYPSRPEELSLYAGIETALQRLQAAGFRLIMIINQAGLAHGYFTAADLEWMHARLSAELERLGVRLDAIYHCPRHPDGTIPELAISCVCRKPQLSRILCCAFPTLPVLVCARHCRSFGILAWCCIPAAPCPKGTRMGTRRTKNKGRPASHIANDQAGNSRK